jgi:hypothetical protein
MQRHRLGRRRPLTATIKGAEHGVRSQSRLGACASGIQSAIDVERMRREHAQGRIQIRMRADQGEAGF